MFTMPITGAMPALPTPFIADGSAIDLEALRAHVDHCVDGGVSGLVVGGGTGEFTSLTFEERQRSVATVVAQSGGRVPVIAHTGGMTPREAIDHAVHAQTVGANALMVGVPYYEPLSRRQVLKYFAAIAASVDLPLMPYNYPYATGVDLAPDLMAELVETIPAIQYLKDSSGNLVNQARTKELLGERISIFSGSDWQSGPALLMGAGGVINGGANVFPGAFHRMCRASTNGDPETVASEWLRLLPFLLFLEGRPFVSVIKNALRLVGSTMGTVVRPPAEDMVKADEKLLEGIVADLAERA